MTSASDEIAYFKSLVSQLTDRIKELEAKAASKIPTKTPAQQLRTGPHAQARTCSVHVLIRFPAVIHDEESSLVDEIGIAFSRQLPWRILEVGRAMTRSWCVTVTAGLAAAGFAPVVWKVEERGGKGAAGIRRDRPSASVRYRCGTGSVGTELCELLFRSDCIPVIGR